MIIKGASVYGMDQHFHDDVDILILNGVFVDDKSTVSEEEETIDATGYYAIPGLVDIHFHGAMGYDICDASIKAYEEIARYEASAGVTAICPATLTLSVDELEKVLTLGAAFHASQEAHTALFQNDSHKYADLVGFNMEGPFISVKKKGAQNEDYIISADTSIVNRFLEASDGLLKIIGLAPEVNPNFRKYVEEVKDKVVVSLAHTNANYQTAIDAINQGASHVVHLYNAMTGLTHREPGVVGAVSDANDPCKVRGSSHPVNVEIICDGIHVDGAAVRAAFRMNGRDRMVFISDSLRSTGMPDGEYRIGGQPIVKNGRFCTLKEGGNLAGSVTNLTDCMRNAVLSMEIPIEVAVAASTINPAKAIGIDNLYGSIDLGKRGNVLLLHKADLKTGAVIKDGKVIVNNL